MMSTPRCMNRSGSRMCSMLASDPVSKLSAQITRLPRASSSSQRWEPKKPAPPVTRQVDTGTGEYPPRALSAGRLRLLARVGPYHPHMAIAGAPDEDPDENPE